MLYVEIIFDLFVLGLAGGLMLRARHHRLSFMWGLVVALLALQLLHDNLYWIMHTDAHAQQDHTELLSFSRMFKWFLFAQIIPLFPLASLRPGWLTPHRLIGLILPMGCVSLIALCYLKFNGYISPLYQASDILYFLNMLDVKVRLLFFIATILIPFFYFMLPFLPQWFPSQRKVTPLMRAYIGSSLILFILYIFFSLHATEWLFDLYGYAILIFPTLFTIACLRNKNPWSTPDLQNTEAKVVNYLNQRPVRPEIYTLHQQMTVYMTQEIPYTDCTYTIERLQEALHTTRPLLQEAIRYGGFSDFEEYIHFLRLTRYQQEVLQHPELPAQELMTRCGLSQ
ncbi:MAG: hypothetical protein PHV49_01325 [Alistipes sp.]|nr:hypothetical protein [Alistipes sp.]